MALIVLIAVLILYGIVTTGMLIAHHKWLTVLSGRIDNDRASTYRLP